MISEESALEQVIRLSGLRMYPAGKEAQQEIVKALMAISENEQEAEKFVTEWIRYETDAPTPAHLYNSKFGDRDYYEVPELL